MTQFCVATGIISVFHGFVIPVRSAKHPLFWPMQSSWPLAVNDIPGLCGHFPGFLSSSECHLQQKALVLRLSWIPWLFKLHCLKFMQSLSSFGTRVNKSLAKAVSRVTPLNVSEPALGNLVQIIENCVILNLHSIML